MKPASHVGFSQTASARSSWGMRLVVALPYLWLAVFFILPFLIVARLSLSQTAMAQPPYLPIFDLAAGWGGLRDFFAALSLDNFGFLFSDTLYIDAALKSLSVALLSTLLLAVFGLPVAYALARAPRRFQPILLTAVILPFWTAFLIRIYAWINILQREGLLNDALMALHIIDAPVGWLASDAAVYIGMIYSYLPFMILPVYAALEKMDEQLLEAAADLGCPRWKSFWLVTLPIALPGIFAGALLCFIPIVGEFVIPDLLGGSQSLMIGQALWTEFFSNKDWPVASALAVMLFAILLVPIMLYQRLQTREVGGR